MTGQKGPEGASRHLSPKRCIYLLGNAVLDYARQGPAIPGIMNTRSGGVDIPGGWSLVVGSFPGGSEGLLPSTVRGRRRA